jgi:hypothetical protein
MIAAVSPFHSMRALPHLHGRILRKGLANFVQAQLQAARTSVENENLHSMMYYQETAVQM